ncbi:MAG: hypothetical protein Q8K92_08320 [Leadbetterella sp.]|nr:hypothetical protein [Leadbetterella sp.]
MKEDKSILNIPLEIIANDTRSLTRITNMVLEKKIKRFASKELVFRYVVETENKFTVNDTFIEITHKKRGYRKHDWKVYLFQDEFCGILIKYLSYTNYVWIRDKDVVGEFISSKGWVNKGEVKFRMKQLENQIGALEYKKRLLETYCG